MSRSIVLASWYKQIICCNISLLVLIITISSCSLPAAPNLEAKKFSSESQRQSQSTVNLTLPTRSAEPLSKSPVNFKFSPLQLEPATDYTDNNRILYRQNRPYLSKVASAINLLLQKYVVDMDNLGLVYFDLNTDDFITINKDQVFEAASTIKVPLAIMMLEQIASGEFSLQTNLTYEACDFEGGSGIIQNTPVGSTFSLKELLRLSIVESDNIATNMMLRWLNIYTQQNGLELVKSQFAPQKKLDHNLTTPTVMANALYYLWQNPKQNPYFDLLKTWLSQAAVTYLGLHFDDSIEFYHKHGMFALTFAEIAWIQKPNHNILISVFFKAPQRTEKSVVDFLSELGEILSADNS